MRTLVRIVVAGFALLSVINLQASNTNETNTTLGVAVTLPGGTVDRFAIPNDAAPKTPSMIPLKGSNGVYGVRVEPYLSDGLVAVRLSAVVGGNTTPAEGSCLQRGGRGKSIVLGSYVIGKKGESLQIADLGKFGLPNLTVSAAAVSVLPVSAGDPCCTTPDDLICCWSCGGCRTQQCIDACMQEEAECLAVCFP